jgi:hypothetical protein
MSPIPQAAWRPIRTADTSRPEVSSLIPGQYSLKFERKILESILSFLCMILSPLKQCIFFFFFVLLLVVIVNFVLVDDVKWVNSAAPTSVSWA